ncbi:MAG TPA: YggS family pyridoxal phosphate-dependent enzyme [Casimicrobiaceae bacterium]
MFHYEKAWQDVMARIENAARAAGRPGDSVRLLAVSKTFPPAAIRAVRALGQRAFGENYVQEALPKMDALADAPDVEWHLIGPLQSNKTKVAAERFAWVQTIDRAKIAERLSAARPADFPPLNVCIQVNISGEASKSGVPPDDAVALARAVASMPRLKLRGLMGIAEATPVAAARRAQFRILRALFDACRAADLPLDTLSMGMSADVEEAIAEGATLVRIGSALFGERETSRAVSSA